MENMSSPTLLDLPREILDLIFSHFCPHCLGNTEPIWSNELVRSRQTLLALCLVCTQLRSSAQSILFHEYHLAYKLAGGIDHAKSDGPLLSFLNAITQHPYLASRVKRLGLSSSQLKNINRNYAQSMLEEAVLALGTTLSKAWTPRLLDTSSDSADLKRFLGSFLQYRDIGVEEKKFSRKEQEWLEIELMSVVIALLPKLEHFSLDRDYCLSETNLALSLQALEITSLPLHSFSLHSGHDSLALGFLHLTSRLETLHIHQFSAALPEGFALPNLTTLRLTQSQYNEQGLGPLLARCVKLEDFFFEQDWPRECGFNTFDGGYFPPIDVVAHLRHHRHTLRNLHLDLRKWAIGPDPESQVEPIASLEDFGALQHLFMHPALLPVCQPWPLYHSNSTDISTIAWERWAHFLPRTIVSFHLARDFHENGSHEQATELADLADAVADERFPFLKEVRCDANPRVSEFLQERYSTVGVDFGYSDWRPGSLPEDHIFIRYEVSLSNSDDDY